MNGTRAPRMDADMTAERRSAAGGAGRKNSPATMAKARKTSRTRGLVVMRELPCPNGRRPWERGLMTGFRGRQASALLQYSTHVFVSATALEPSGIRYSSSTEAGNFHWRFFIVCRISLIGV